MSCVTRALFIRFSIFFNKFGKFNYNLECRNTDRSIYRNAVDEPKHQELPSSCKIYKFLYSKTIITEFVSSKNFKTAPDWATALLRLERKVEFTRDKQRNINTRECKDNINCSTHLLPISWSFNFVRKLRKSFIFLIKLFQNVYSERE